MGKERDRLIRRLGGVPVSDLDLSDEELMRRRMEYYARQGRLPPEIVALRRRAASAQALKGAGKDPGPQAEKDA